MKDVPKCQDITAPQIIWNNQEVLIAGKPVFLKEFYKCGIVYIKDMFVCETAQESFRLWVNKGLSPKYLLNWYGLRSAALSQYRHMCNHRLKFQEVEGNVPSEITTNNPTVEIQSKLKAKNYYFMIRKSNIDQLPISSKKLMYDFALHGREDLKTYFVLTYKTTKDLKLRDLQYRILTFIYNTNELLRKKKLREKGNCDFCEEEMQTLYHLFFECPHVKAFWEDVENYIYRQEKRRIDLDKKTVILGSLELHINYKVLVGKLCIHKAKCYKEKPSLESFTRALKDKEDICKMLNPQEREEADKQA